jgi:hypothetical protein
MYSSGLVVNVSQMLQINANKSDVTTQSVAVDSKSMLLAGYTIKAVETK